MCFGSKRGQLRSEEAVSSVHHHVWSKKGESYDIHEIELLTTIAFKILVFKHDDKELL